MSKIYAIPDLHGRADLMYQAFAKISDHAGNERRTIVLMGDYIDRGPQSARVLEFLSNARCDEKTVIICLMGNHEAMMLWTIEQPLHPKWWLSNGGFETMMSYSHPLGLRCDTSYVNRQHLNWLKTLPATYMTRHHIFVHAYMRDHIDATPMPHWRGEDPRLWGRYPEGCEDGWRGKHIVHGHHHHPEPELYAGRSNFDTNAWATGKLFIGVFDEDTPGGPIDIIQVVGEPDPRLR